MALPIYLGMHATQQLTEALWFNDGRKVPCCGTG